MKKTTIFYALLILFTAISFVSCDSEPVDPVLLDNNGNNPNPPGTEASFTASLNGQAFVADQYMATIGNGLTSVAGIKTSTGAQVSIVVQGTTPGNYPMAIMNYDPTADSEYGYSNISLSNGQISGSVNITSINTTTHTISGTFSFTGFYGDEAANLPNVEFTNGQFTNIPYTTGVETGDSFTATVDGTAINYANDLAVAYSGAGQYITLNAVGSDHVLHVTISDDLTPGTYPITTGLGSQARAVYTNADDEDFDAPAGTITIISKTATRISGTFSFATTADSVTGEPAHEVINGAFDVEYN